MAGRRHPAGLSDDRSSASSPIAPRRARSQAWWNAVNAWLLLLPAAVLLVAFTHYPILATIKHSLFVARRNGTEAVRRASTTIGRCSSRSDLLEGAGQ